MKKSMLRKVLVVGMLVMFLSLNIVSNNNVNVKADPVLILLPDVPVTIVVSHPWNQASPPGPSYFKTLLSNVPEGEYNVWDGDWRGWCVNPFIVIYPGVTYTMELWSSYDPLIPLSNSNWGTINWIINHKELWPGFNWQQMQNAIWHFFSGDPYTGSNPVTLQIIDDATGHNGFVPEVGDLVAALCWPIDEEGQPIEVQRSFIEVVVENQGGTQPPYPPTLISPGYSSGPGQMIFNLTPTFHWENVSDADYYMIYISKYPYGSNNIVFDSELDYGPIFGTTLKLSEGILRTGEKYRWNMRAYSNKNGFSGFSSRLYFEIGFPSWCSMFLEKDGSSINEIYIEDLFDIHIEKTTNNHDILEIRFLSDDIQDNIPTGEWTKNFYWDVSDNDWDSNLKIKRWSFSTPGHKEIWIELKDEEENLFILKKDIFVISSALPVITAPLIITPQKDIYEIDDFLKAEFTIKNIGDNSINLDVLTVGGRLNGDCPDGGCPDFTFIPKLLQPGESYFYEGYFTPTLPGNYNFFIAYYIQNPSTEEKRLLDENNWNTCVTLGEGLINSDRAKNIIVYDKDDVTKLRETIDKWLNHEFYYPPYLLDENSFRNAIANKWMSFTSFVTRTNLKERYNQLYSDGVEYRRISIKALEEADFLLNNGNIEGARNALQNFYRYNKMYY